MAKQQVTAQEIKSEFVSTFTGEARALAIGIADALTERQLGRLYRALIRDGVISGPFPGEWPK